MARRRQKKTEATSLTKPPKSLASLASAWRTWLPQALLIIAAGIYIYWPSLHGSPLLDDDWYVFRNPLIRASDSLWKFWFLPGTWVEYYPINETVMWLQWRAWGADTLGYHLTNLILHLANAMLVWLLLARLGLRWAWLGGFLFAVLPVQVESVANITELKNTLSLVPFLLSMVAWIQFENNGLKRDYLDALVLFLIAMLCKISAVLFPFVILLYAWWKRGRLQGSDLKRAAPFFLVSLVLGLLTIRAGETYAAQTHAQNLNISLGGFFEVFDRAGLIIGYYIVNSIFPYDLAPIFPKWPTDPGRFASWWPWFVVAFVTAVVWTKRRQWGRHVILGFGFFLINMAPFLGFHAYTYMHDSWVLPHLLYFPVIGLIGLAVAALGDLDMKLHRGRWKIIVPFVVASGLMIWQARAHAGWFIDAETLWGRTLSVYPQSWIARYNLGAEVLKQHRYLDALALLETAQAEDPGYSDGYDNVGIALEKLGRSDDANKEYREALALNPHDPGAYGGLAGIAMQKGDLPGAEHLLRQGLKIAPDDTMLCTDLGAVLFQTGRKAQAIDLYSQAIKTSPDVAQLQYNLGIALMQSGDMPGAAEHLEIAVLLDPDLAAAHQNLGVLLARSGQLPEAISEFEAALRIDPQFVPTRNNLAMAYAQAGNIPAATAQFEKVLQIDPNNAQARGSLEKIKQFQMKH